MFAVTIEVPELRFFKIMFWFLLLRTLFAFPRTHCGVKNFRKVFAGERGQKILFFCEGRVGRRGGGGAT